MLLGAGGAIFLLWGRSTPDDVATQAARNPATAVPVVVATPPSVTRPRVEPPPKPEEAVSATPSTQQKPEPPSQPVPASAVKLAQVSTDTLPQPDYPVAAKGGRLAEKLRELTALEQPDDATEIVADRPDQRVVTRPVQPARVIDLPSSRSADLVSEIVMEERDKVAEQAVIKPDFAQKAQIQPAMNQAVSVPVQSDLDLYYRTLPLAQQNGVPITPVSVHVYYADPTRRFILGGRRRYAEGDLMPNGVKLESITRRGIILEYQGKQYRHDFGSGG